MADTNLITNYLRDTFFVGSNYSFHSVLGIHDSSNTTAYVYFNVINNSDDKTYKSNCKLIFLRNDKWYLYELTIFDSKGKVLLYYNNLLIPIN